MGFINFTNSTTADATEVNDNFYHVAQSHLLPRGGSSLDATDGVYDIGSLTYTFDNIFVNSISASILTDNLGIWTKETEIVLTATASNILITGLDSESYGYLVVAYVVVDGATTNSNSIYNSRQGGGHFGYSGVLGTGAGLTDGSINPGVHFQTNTGYCVTFYKKYMFRGDLSAQTTSNYFMSGLYGPTMHSVQETNVYWIICPHYGVGENSTNSAASTFSFSSGAYWSGPAYFAPDTHIIIYRYL